MRKGVNSSLKFINDISLLIEFDEDFRNNIPIEDQHKIRDIIDNENKFYETKNKKAFFNCINDISYNFHRSMWFCLQNRIWPEDLILATWKLIQPNLETESDDEPPIIGNNYNYSSDDSE